MGNRVGLPAHLIAFVICDKFILIILHFLVGGTQISLFSNLEFCNNKSPVTSIAISYPYIRSFPFFSQDLPNHRVKVKTKIRDELKKSRYDPERVKGLMVTNQQKQEKVIQLQNEGTLLLLFLSCIKYMGFQKLEILK